MNQLPANGNILSSCSHKPLPHNLIYLYVPHFPELRVLSIRALVSFPPFHDVFPVVQNSLGLGLPNAELIRYLVTRLSAVDFLQNSYSLLKIKDLFLPAAAAAATSLRAHVACGRSCACALSKQVVISSRFAGRWSRCGGGLWLEVYLYGKCVSTRGFWSVTRGGL